MDPALFACASGLSALEHDAANTMMNLVHSRTPGYRPRLSLFSSFDAELAHASERQAPIVRSEDAVNHAPGLFVPDSNPYSFSIHGEGFFSIETPAGTRFTRNGQFTLDGEGGLVTASGYKVLDWNGPLRIDASRGPVTVSPEGELVQGGETVGALRIVTFADRSALVPAGDTLFAARDGAAEAKAGDPDVRGGELEYPSETGVDSLIGLITTQRAFEATQRALRLVADSYRNLMGGNG
jgi:flagellar basal body rod protein FlgG